MILDWNSGVEGGEWYTLEMLGLYCEDTANFLRLLLTFCWFDSWVWAQTGFKTGSFAENLTDSGRDVLFWQDGGL